KDNEAIFTKLSVLVTITNDHLSQITWQRTIKGKYRNEKDFRFEFIGNFNDKNGTLKFSNVTLKDEGSYTCIFSLFPSGTPMPSITNLMDYTPLEGNEEVPLATCTAAASKPKADVRWIKGSLEGKVREELKETRHANGTTTTWSTLLGKPGREMNGQLVQCVISSEATNEEILETNIQVQCKYLQTSSKWVWPAGGFSSQSNDLSGLYQCETKSPYGSKQAYLFVQFSTGEFCCENKTNT
uniref:Ig-like domain-containing protein n=1 Tax=Oryzias latipes TaxID=8090 RepID=A0A3P9HPJ4_ORYLA